MILLLPIAALAADDTSTVAGHLDQARFFIKKGWYGDARRELEEAVALPDGGIDPEVWYLLATVRYQQLDVQGASEAAERAQTYARDDDQLSQSATFAAFLREQFGVIEVHAPYPGFVGKLDVEPTSAIFDPELKAYVGRISDQLGGHLTFPVRLSLPAGDYTINGGAVIVQPGVEQIVERTSSELAHSPFANAQLARAEIGVGLSMWLGRSTAHLEPGPSLHVGLVQPVGALIAGVFTDWSPRGYDTIDGKIVASPLGWGVGARLGVELPGTGVVAIRPSLGWRLAQIPGVPRNCEAAADGVMCTDRGPADVVVYSIGLANVALAELSVDWIDRSRKRTVGLGVKFIGEQAFGFLPASGTARLPDGSDLSYTIVDRHFSSTGVRFMPTVAISF